MSNAPHMTWILNMNISNVNKIVLQIVNIRPSRIEKISFIV